MQVLMFQLLLLLLCCCHHVTGMHDGYTMISSALWDEILNVYDNFSITKYDLAVICMHNVLYAATVVLNSSVGMRQACPGEMVTYTCTVNQGIGLEWIVEPFLPANDPIQFTSTDTVGSRLDCSAVAAVRCEDFEFVAILTNTANPTVVFSNTLADITSTLTFTATNRLNGKVVQCRGTTIDASLITNSTLNVAGAPMLLFLLPATKIIQR